MNLKANYSIFLLNNNLEKVKKAKRSRINNDQLNLLVKMKCMK